MFIGNMSGFACFLNHALSFICCLFFLLVDDQPEKGGNTQCVKNVHKSGSEQVGKHLFSSAARILKNLSPGSGLED